MKPSLARRAFNDFLSGAAFVSIAPWPDSGHDGAHYIHALLVPFFMERDFFRGRAAKLRARQRIGFAFALVRQKARLRFETWLRK